ncbi:universal stress protein A-like protein [Magnolia sinica]|uniref:universal stress protein A-like protein n=1 Tax=Magnolia sinica TaxID=86752 RepID=UPI002659BF08|nr:universal stress protein A-like protein [Magnolia sinica]
MAESSNTKMKKVIVIGVDSSSESLHSLEWTLDNLIPTCESLFKLVLIHVKIQALSVLRFAGPGVGDVVSLVETDLKKTATLVTEKVKEICDKRSFLDYKQEVMEGDARNVLCEAVDKHNADILVVGSHGYGAFKRVILGSVSDYCAHHANCSVLIVKKPKIAAR